MLIKTDNTARSTR